MKLYLVKAGSGYHSHEEFVIAETRGHARKLMNDHLYNRGMETTGEIVADRIDLENGPPRILDKWNERARIEAT